CRHRQGAEGLGRPRQPRRIRRVRGQRQARSRLRQLGQPDLADLGHGNRQADLRVRSGAGRLLRSGGAGGWPAVRIWGKGWRGAVVGVEAVNANQKTPFARTWGIRGDAPCSWRTRLRFSVEIGRFLGYTSYWFPRDAVMF